MQGDEAACMGHTRKQHFSVQARPHYSTVPQVMVRYSTYSTEQYIQKVYSTVQQMLIIGAMMVPRRPSAVAVGSAHLSKPYGSQALTGGQKRRNTAGALHRLIGHTYSNKTASVTTSVTQALCLKRHGSTHPSIAVLIRSLQASGATRQASSSCKWTATSETTALKIAIISEEVTLQQRQPAQHESTAPDVQAIEKVPATQTARHSGVIV
jgi:hypothetical protein